MSMAASALSREQGLQVVGLNKKYGGLTVASDINISIRPGDRTALIGPNGAGKTTFAGLVTGVIAPSSGKVFLDGEEITGLAQAKRVKAGIVRTFQITTLLRAFTAREHVRLAILERRNMGWRMVARADGYPDIEAESDKILAQLGLTADADEPVDLLPYGKQRLVEIALALALRPRILLLDEPAAGVPSSESRVIIDAIRSLPEELGVLIIEHDMDLVFSFATRIIVLVAGSILTQGTPAEIAADPRVRELYLGDLRDEH
jgi:branched-chain amino acid transport system ATP-binding protein